MRTIITLVIFLLNLQYCFSQGNRTDYADCIKVDIGAYSTNDQVRRVFAVTSKDTSNIYLIGVYPTNNGIRAYYKLKRDGPIIYLHYTDTLYNTLKRIEQKYKEWTEIAKNNVTGMFEKEIPIELPIAGVSIWNIDKPQFELMPVDKKRYTFDKVNLNVPPILHIHMYSYFTYYHEHYRRKEKGSVETISFFLNTDQFSKFVELFEPNKIRENMGNKTIDELFK